MKKLIIATVFILLLAPCVWAAVCVEGNDVTLTLTAPSDASGIKLYEIYRATSVDMTNAVKVGEFTSTAAAGSIIQGTDANVPDGSYYYRVRAIDRCNNWSETAISNEVTVDTEPPVWGDDTLTAG